MVQYFGYFGGAIYNIGYNPKEKGAPAQAMSEFADHCNIVHVHNLRAPESDKLDYVADMRQIIALASSKNMKVIIALHELIRASDTEGNNATTDFKIWNDGYAAMLNDLKQHILAFYFDEPPLDGNNYRGVFETVCQRIHSDVPGIPILAPFKWPSLNNPSSNLRKFGIPKGVDWVGCDYYLEFSGDKEPFAALPTQLYNTLNSMLDSSHRLAIIGDAYCQRDTTTSFSSKTFASREANENNVAYAARFLGLLSTVLDYARRLVSNLINPSTASLIESPISLSFPMDRDSREDRRVIRAHEYYALCRNDSRIILYLVFLWRNHEGSDMLTLRSLPKVRRVFRTIGSEITQRVRSKPYNSASMQFTILIKNVKPDNQFVFLLAPNLNLFAIKKNGTDSRTMHDGHEVPAVEVHVVTAESEYRERGLGGGTGTNLPATGSDNQFVFLLAPNLDLFAIKKNGTNSRTMHDGQEVLAVEVFVLTAASGYKQRRLETGTNLPATGSDNQFVFLLAPNLDLFVIKKNGTNSRTMHDGQEVLAVEVFVLTAASGYKQRRLETGTNLPATGSDNQFVFLLAPNLDLFAIKKNDTDSRTMHDGKEVFAVEVFVLTADSNYKQRRLETGTNLPATGSDDEFVFLLAPNLDLFVIRKTGGEYIELFMLDS